MSNIGPKLPPISLWRFEDAPMELRELSDHGGDEDYLMLIPAGLTSDIPYWVDDWWEREWRSKSEFALKDGSIVRIAAHA